jgi:hypothetical protein
LTLNLETNIPIWLFFKMATSDLDMLIDMGFDAERAKIAVKKTGSRTSYAHTTRLLIIVQSRTPSIGWATTRTGPLTRSKRKSPGGGSRRPKGHGHADRSWRGGPQLGLQRLRKEV